MVQLCEHKSAKLKAIIHMNLVGYLNHFLFHEIEDNDE